MEPLVIGIALLGGYFLMKNKNNNKEEKKVEKTPYEKMEAERKENLTRERERIGTIVRDLLTHELKEKYTNNEKSCYLEIDKKILDSSKIKLSSDELHSIFELSIRQVKNDLKIPMLSQPRIDALKRYWGISLTW